MKIIPYVKNIADNKVFFEVQIFSEEEEKQVGVASVITGCNPRISSLYFCDYYIPEEYFVTPLQIFKACQQVLMALYPESAAEAKG